MKQGYLGGSLKTATWLGIAAVVFAVAGCDDKGGSEPAKPDATTAKSAAAKPTAEPTATATASAEASAAAPADSAAQPSDGPAYRDVPHAEWVGIVGPKLPAGATVAHKVFEGWPTEKALFVITKEDNKFFARVFADGRVYKAGPLANPALEASRINAVSFFDADGDNKVDAVIIARYKEGDDHNPHNALLAWTTTSIERMTALEPKVEKLETIDEIKKELAKP